jgi:hypothetical protein
MRIVCRLPLGNIRDTFDHTNNSFANDDEREKLQPLDEMCVFEADDTPNDGDEEDRETLYN